MLARSAHRPRPGPIDDITSNDIAVNFKHKPRSKRRRRKLTNAMGAGGDTAVAVDTD
jgi:hypothetical protein